MPVLSSPTVGATPPKVLVIGANGYLALWVLYVLLEKGYAVRGTARSEKKVEELIKVFDRGTFRPEWKERVEWVVVEDISKDGAFDEAVKGVDAIAHISAALSSVAGDLEEYLGPSVRSAVGVLESALKFGPTIKRIVITSSVAAIVSENPPPGKIYTEGDWADEAVEVAKKEGNKAGFMAKYSASKVLAERAAFEFVEKHKGEVGFDIVTLAPPYIVGPTLLSPETPSKLNASLGQFYGALTDDKADDFLKSTFPYIDVRDSALTHLLALTKPEAGGERLITAAGSVTWQTSRDIAYKTNPKLYEDGIFPRGNADLPKDITLAFNNEKGKRILGIEYKSLEETVRDSLADFEARGWLVKKPEVAK